MAKAPAGLSPYRKVGALPYTAASAPCTASLREQRRFVLWWDEEEKNPGGNPSQTKDGLLPELRQFRAQFWGLDIPFTE